VALYVIAIVDTPLAPFRVGQRPFRSVKCAPGVFAIIERRAEAPTVTDLHLRAQHRAVVQASRKVDAILPVRFGTLLQADDLIDVVRNFEEDIHEALEDVRGKVQMTIRVVGGPHQVAPRKKTTHHKAPGRDHLEALRAALHVPIPTTARPVLRAVEPFVVRERRERGPGLATIYHLVKRENVRLYRTAFDENVIPAAHVTGPWPPFAFTPRLF
jgi:hypothetical protein